VIQGPKANWFNLMHIRFDPGRSTSANLADMEKVFRKYNPDYPFQYEFIDQEYAKKFKEDQTTETLTGLFAALTIFISCLGLFGLSAYMAEVKTKEIGVRKVLGASAASITFLLSREFVQLVFIAFLIASPIAWFSMHKWLQGFDYHVSLSWWNFAIAGLLSLAIAIGTVSSQTIRAAMLDPAKNLRTE
jgi:ABC-type antimicrobial peptide transport system permease subunit